MAQDMENIVQQNDRIARLAKSLLGFSRQTPQILHGVSLNKLLDRVLDIIRLRLNDVVVEKDYDPDVPLIQADPGQLEQVFTNLAVNALQAMAKGGQLTFRTGRSTPDRSPGVFAAVSDTGCGIPQENVERIFEPYFTTKKAGEGTGLGLYVCKNIVEQHHGTIDVESQVGVGTTFTISMPLKQPGNEIA